MNPALRAVDVPEWIDAGIGLINNSKKIKIENFLNLENRKKTPIIIKGKSIKCKQPTCCKENKIVESFPVINRFTGLKVLKYLIAISLIKKLYLLIKMLAYGELKPNLLTELTRPDKKSVCENNNSDCLPPYLLKENINNKLNIPISIVKIKYGI